jgi:MSHA biogenesis protein MshJ
VNAWWQQQLSRVDALSLRERVFLFLSVIVCLIALADTFWLAPAQATQAQLAKRFATQSSELVRLRAELSGAAPPVDPARLVRDDIAQADVRLQELDQEIRFLLPQAQNGPALEQVLVQFLRRQEGLTLVSLTTIKGENPDAAGAAAAPAAAGLTRRGLELRVMGAYPQLVRYLRTLEQALPSLRWGSMQVKSEKLPPELTVQVFVLGVQQ